MRASRPSSTPAQANQAAHSFSSPTRGASTRSAGSFSPSRSHRAGLHRGVKRLGISRAHSTPGQSPSPDLRAMSMFSRGEVDDGRTGVQPYRQSRIGHLERPQPGRQPLGRQGRQGGDRQHALIRLGHLGEGAAQHGHRLGRRPRQPLALFGRLDLARQAAEQAEAQPGLQRLDLPADRGLGHAEFLGRAREAVQAGRRLEHADGRQGQAGEGITHKDT